MSGYILTLPDGETRLYRSPELAHSKHGELGGTLRCIPYEEDKLRPGSTMVFGPSGRTMVEHRA